MIIIELKKLENETEEAYLWRIGQLVDSGQIESWKSINNIINEQLGIDEDSYRDESSFRKKYQAAKKFYENVFVKREPDEYQKELDIKIRTLEKERQKLYSTKIEYTRNIRQQSRFELYYENVKNAITTLPLPKFFYNINYDNNNKKEYLLGISDIHYGAKFESENNHYSTEEVKYRFEVLLEKTIKFIKQNKLNKLNVVSLGDDIQGILRLTDLQLNESTVVQAVVEVSRLIATFLNELSAYCLIEYYHTPTANHSQTRPLGTKASEIASEDVEYIIGNYIKDMLATNNKINVNLNFGKDYIKIPIFNYEIIALHGHTVKSIENILKDLSMLHRTFYDYCIIGHSHSSKEITGNEGCLNDTEVLVCPSFIGSDPYADSLMKGSKAACKIYVFDEDEGHTETHKLQLN